MRLFEKQLYEALQGITWNYIDPDTIYNTWADWTTFIYFPTGQIEYSTEDTHADLLVKINQEEIDDLEDDHDQTYNYMAWQTYNKIRDQTLMGRIGHAGDDPNAPYKEIISFWPSNAMDNLLPACLERLTIDGYLKADSLISIDGVGTVAPDTAKNSVKPTIQNLDTELRRKMHMMQPAQKKAAMDKLNIPRSKKNKWQQGAEQTGIIKPGQKWWAMTSESK